MDNFEGAVTNRLPMLNWVALYSSTYRSHLMDFEGYQKKKEDMKLGSRLVGNIWGERRGKIEVDMITIHWTHI